MFVVSVKSNKIKIALILVCALAICAISIYAALNRETAQGSEPVLIDGGVSLRASNDEERIAFFSQYGWEIDEEPIEVKEITIPQEFDDEYEKYNGIQKKQNLDLSPYKGQRVKKWTYNIKNYPGYEEKDGYVTGNILVYNGAVIGGDISGLKNGEQFVQIFEFPENAAVSEKESTSSVQQETTEKSE